MAAFQIRIHPTAREDIESSASWIAERASSEKALEWIDTILETIESLTELPSRCPLAPENWQMGTRRTTAIAFSGLPLEIPHSFSYCERHCACPPSSARRQTLSA